MSTQRRQTTGAQVPVATMEIGLNGASPPLTFACPACGGPLEVAGPDELRCPIDQQLFQRIDGIWRMMTSERAAHFEQFIQDYETVRQGEGRGAEDPDYYRSLPETDLSGRFAGDWAIRATSFRALISGIIEPLEGKRPRSLNILDLGAGNGWLSNRLAGRGHRLTAVDLQINASDGLGAHIHYETDFTPVQAEFDRLPFAGGQFDLVIFNGSLHYSTDCLVTLGEALRVSRPDGILVILDTPVYQNPASGAAMVHEREEAFTRQYGFASNAIPSENFLTYRRLDDLAGLLGLEWRYVKPDYGLRWKLRPWKAKLRRSREPATFMLIAGRRERASRNGHRSITRAAARQWLTWRYWLTQRGSYNRLVLEDVAGRPMLVLPQVFNPKLFRTGPFLAEVFEEQPLAPGAIVLDLGAGSGIGAITAARRASSVVAVDINPEAVRCARINAQVNGVEDRVEVRLGDLFEPVQGERFDVILFNPPFYRGEPRDLLDHAWRAQDVIERFGEGVAEHLAPAGYALVVLSSDGEAGAFLEAFRKARLDVTVTARRNLINESLTVYRLSAKG